MANSYYQKYIKYKNKYLALKKKVYINQKGASQYVSANYDLEDIPIDARIRYEKYLSESAEKKEAEDRKARQLLLIQAKKAQEEDAKKAGEENAKKAGEENAKKSEEVTTEPFKFKKMNEVELEIFKLNPRKRGPVRWQDGYNWYTSTIKGLENFKFMVIKIDSENPPNFQVRITKAKNPVSDTEDKFQTIEDEVIDVDSVLDVLKE